MCVFEAFLQFMNIHQHEPQYGVFKAINIPYIQNGACNRKQPSVRWYQRVPGCVLPGFCWIVPVCLRLKKKRISKTAISGSWLWAPQMSELGSKNKNC